MPMFFKNHKSLYEDDALALLWPTIAKNIWKGVMEYVSRHEPVPRSLPEFWGCSWPKRTARCWVPQGASEWRG